VGYSIKKKLKDDWHYSDRDSQIKAIEKTFEDSAKPITSHFSKPKVTPLEILPIFPDFKLWKYPCAQVKGHEFKLTFKHFHCPIT